MKVLKFGGTSVGTVESLLNVKKIVESTPDTMVIVVSALGGLTDKLIATAGNAKDKSSHWKEEMSLIVDRHFHIIDNIVPQHLRENTKQKVGELLEELEKSYEKIYESGRLSEKDLDEIVSYGEKMSSEIVASMIENGKRYYSPDFIKTERRYGKNVADHKLTEQLIQETFSSLGKNEKAIVPGFISTDKETGETTNLGRGGSDFTGALIAAALNAEVLEIWTDVDGFMTADPRVVKDALIIDHLTFSESMELCTFGAKVIYPPTIYPVFHKNIPIKILNTFNPSAPGTLVTDHPHKDDFDVKGVTVHKNISLLSIKLKDSEMGKEIEQRGLNVLLKDGVNILPLKNDYQFDLMNFGVNSGDGEIAFTALSKEFEKEINQGKLSQIDLKENLAAIAVVGKNMRERNRLSARIGHSLQRDGINVIAFSDNSDTTWIYIINQEKANEALPLIHSLLF